MKFGVAVKAIIRKEGKILVVKRAQDDGYRAGTWETVGGSIDENESPSEALRREIMEESGLEVEIVEPFNVFSFKKDSGKVNVIITFVCDWLSGEVALSEEHSDFKWILPEDFALLESVPSQYQEINDYAKKYYGQER